MSIYRADRLQGLQLVRERNDKVTAEMTERVGAATASEQLQVPYGFECRCPDVRAPNAFSVATRIDIVL
jgi:hypothetical protein